MDDLQDAIQDAMFMGAMCKAMPQPTAPLNLPSVEEAKAYGRELKARDPESLTFDGVISQPLGWFLFKQYLAFNASTRPFDFVEKTQEYAAIMSRDFRVMKARVIDNEFLRPADVSSGSSPLKPLTPSSLGPGSGSAATGGRSGARAGTGTGAGAGAGTGAGAGAGAGPGSGARLGAGAGSGAGAGTGIATETNNGGVTPSGESVRPLLSPSTPSVLKADPAVRSPKPASAALPSSASPPKPSKTPSPSPSRPSGGGAGSGAGSGSGAGAGSGQASDPAHPEGSSSSLFRFPSAAARRRRSPDDALALRNNIMFRPGRHGKAIIRNRQSSLAFRSRAAALYSSNKNLESPLGVAGNLVSNLRRIIMSVPVNVLAATPRGGSGTPTGSVSVADVSRSGRSSGPPPPIQADVLGRPVVPDLPSDLFDDLRDAVIDGCRARHWIGFEGSSQYTKLLQLKLLATHPVDEEQFHLFRVLGRGGFGSVNGCKKTDTGKLYAMKVMSKKRIKAKNASDLCWNERVVLSKVDSPFVVSLKYAFQTEANLYLVMDLMTGGDLAFHLGKNGRFDAARARFYAAEVLLGLEHLHSLNIVYRDLKPENVLLDAYGHCRLTDMGLAMHMTPRLAGRCGTRGYWAPEMLVKVDGRRQTYSFTVDWWSYGCFVYELMAGKCPFRTEDARCLDPDKHKSMDKATLHMEVRFDARLFNEDAQRLIQGLLTRDPTRRLGALGAVEIKAHPFFEGIDWGMLETGQLPARWIPDQNINAASQEAIGSFDHLDRIELTSADHARYAGWACNKAWAHQVEMIEYLAWEEAEGPIEPVKFNDSCCAIC